MVRRLARCTTLVRLRERAPRVPEAPPVCGGPGCLPFFFLFPFSLFLGCLCLSPASQRRAGGHASLPAPPCPTRQGAPPPPVPGTSGRGKACAKCLESIANRKRRSREGPPPSAGGSLTYPSGSSGSHRGGDRTSDEASVKKWIPAGRARELPGRGRGSFKPCSPSPRDPRKAAPCDRRRVSRGDMELVLPEAGFLSAWSVGCVLTA